MSKNTNKLIAIGIIGLAAGLMFRTKKKFSISLESNCDDLLKKFDQLISISPEKIENLKRAHETIRAKIRNYFENRTNFPVPDFYIQGSYKMKTIVENSNSKCDVDLAVIFPSDPEVRLEVLQNHVKNALWNHTTKGIILKSTCVRLNYVRDFHIDLPIYFKDRHTGDMYFGSKGNDWEPSEPKAFVEWFSFETAKKPQLVRVIRYLKAWTDHAKTKTRKKFPSGLVLTLWAIEYYQPESRDDVALFNTCTKILNYLNDNFKYSWSAKMPVEPYDNVLDRLSSSQKSQFYEELKEMVSLMAEALSTDHKSHAIYNFRRVFGNRFG